MARDVALKESAQRAFVAYVKSVFLMRDKSIFNVHALNTDAYARYILIFVRITKHIIPTPIFLHSRSLGLALPPRIRFLQRMQKNSKQDQANKKDKKEVSRLIKNFSKSQIDSEEEEKEEEDDENEEHETSEEESVNKNFNKAGAFAMQKSNYFENSKLY